MMFSRPFCRSKNQAVNFHFTIASSMTKGHPKYFYLLTSLDQESYGRLRCYLNKKLEKRHRGQRLDLLKDCLKTAKTWAQRGDDDDWKRCLVVGVCYLDCGIALNLHQFRLLTNKCKSSMNGALRLMGYETTSARGDVNPELVRALPILEGNIPELRQWSVRTPSDYVPPAELAEEQKDENAKQEFDISENLDDKGNDLAIGDLEMDATWDALLTEIKHTGIIW